jgi:hypothetical protein
MFLSRSASYLTLPTQEKMLRKQKYKKLEVLFALKSNLNGYLLQPFGEFFTFRDFSSFEIISPL